MPSRKQSRKPYKQPPPSPIEISFWNAAKPLIPELQREVWVDRKYRVDFLIPSRRIVIELYGYQHHNSKEKITKDAKRERYLQKIGYQVIRFTGTEIFNDVRRCVGEVISLAKIQTTNSIFMNSPAREPGNTKVSILSVDGVYSKTIAHPSRTHRPNPLSRIFLGMKLWQVGILALMLVSFIGIWLCLVFMVVSTGAY